MVTMDDLPPDVHGGIDSGELARLGLRGDQVLDFSANVNPFGPSPAVRGALRDAAFDHYPDRKCRDLAIELAARHGVAEDRVLVGNGSSELIWLAAVAFLSAGDRVVVLGPTFSGYERSARLMGASVVTIRARAKEDFHPPFDAFAVGITELQPRLAFLANPNNPTGQVVSRDAVFALAVQNPRTLFVLDEAYADCARESLRKETDAPANVLLLRSLTKAHGLAGLRLGYAVGAPGFVDVLRAVQPPWSVNAHAQAGGLAALRDEQHLHETTNRWRTEAVELVRRLRSLGFTPVPSETPFFLLPVGNAVEARSALLRQGVLVRDCTSFGLPEYVRISSRSRADNARLVSVSQAEIMYRPRS